MKITDEAVEAAARALQVRKCHATYSDVARAVLEAAESHRKPRTITTAAEMDALNFESVVKDAYDTPYICESHRTDGTRNKWRMTGQVHLCDSDDILFHGPAVVLWEPEA